jgi:hypothetical protein
MKNTTSKSKFTRILLWLGGILGGLVLIYAAVVSIMMSRRGAVPTDLDYSTTRASEKGLFNVAYTVSTGAIPINQIHQWTLHIEDAKGNPVEQATIIVDGDMPQHGHGLPTQPRVTKYLGNGDYLVDGMKFQMKGWWVMDFNITSDSQSDVVHFNMMLK